LEIKNVIKQNSNMKQTLKYLKSLVKYVIAIILFIILLTIAQLLLPQGQIELTLNEAIAFVVVGVIAFAIALKATFKR